MCVLVWPQAELLRLQDQLKSDHDKMSDHQRELLVRTEQLETDLASALQQLQVSI